MIEINGTIYRNIQEQVEKNKDDIEDLNTDLNTKQDKIIKHSIHLFCINGDVTNVISLMLENSSQVLFTKASLETYVANHSFTRKLVFPSNWGFRRQTYSGGSYTYDLFTVDYIRGLELYSNPNDANFYAQFSFYDPELQGIRSVSYQIASITDEIIRYI